jgi:hypothetical protein
MTLPANVPLVKEAWRATEMVCTPNILRAEVGPPRFKSPLAVMSPFPFTRKLVF